MKLFMLAMLASHSLLAIPAFAEADDEQEAAVDQHEVSPFSRFGLGARAGGAFAVMGFPMLGPAGGLELRVRIVDWIAIEPHVDAVMPTFFLIGILGAQAGTPIVFERAGDSGSRHHVGFGPLVSYATLFGHIDEPVPPITLVGGELLVGTGWALADWLEARLQLRGFVLASVPDPQVMAGVTATAGVMWTL